MKLDYKAPWGKKLKITTALFAGLCLGFAWALPFPASLILIGVLAFSGAFCVRGYSIREGVLLIHRLGWATRIDLSGLERAAFLPDATVGSIRTLGIGGLFGFVGFFRNATLGAYRAFVTDSANTVVLEAAGRKVVVSPGQPELFVETVLQLHPGAAAAVPPPPGAIRQAESES